MLHRIVLHEKYLIIEFGGKNDRYVYDLDKFRLNGAFIVETDYGADYGVEYAGKYAFMKNYDYEHSEKHEAYKIIDLDTLTEKPNSIPEKFIDNDETVLKSAAKILFCDEMNIYCYDIIQDKIIWQLALNGYKHRKIFDLKDDTFLIALTFGQTNMHLLTIMSY